MDDKEFEYKMGLLDVPMDECDKMIEENSTHFENKITYISAGAIAILFTFSDKHSNYKFLLIIGIIFLFIACMMNLYSYIWYNTLLRKDSDLLYDIRCGLKYINGDKNILREYYKKNQKDIELSNAEFHKFIVNKIETRCRKADNYNKMNLYILFIGFIFIAIYVVLNLI